MLDTTPADHDTAGPTVAGVTVPARDVASVIRSWLPTVGVKKVHKLLYYAQGHHLATFGVPLFDESLMAWDMGPVVGSLWFDEKSRPATSAPDASALDRLTEGQLNTIGYVLSRYGSLTGQDLENLSHSEMPWRTADRHRAAGQSVRIERDWLREYFSTDGAASGDEESVPLDSETVKEWLRAAVRRTTESVAVTTREDILLWATRRG